MSANEPGQPALTSVATITSFDLTVPRVALAIGAHPDDVEFGCGGTLAKWAAAGCVVHHLVCTDGAKGTWNPDADTAALALTRQHEQRAAARELGANGEVVFLGWPDGELDSGLRQRWQVTYWIRKLRPDVVLGHDPWKRYRLHPDHRHAGLLACDAVVAARDPHFFKEQELPHHRPSSLLLWEADAPDHAEDVTSFVDTKVRALVAHESQLESTMHAVSDEQVAAFGSRIRARLRELGTPLGLGSAEVFKLISDL
jgi:LmbE family N-acetylglucosaminyl deacetylase